MNLITDVHYHSKGAQAAGILFEWQSETVYGEYTAVVDQVHEYQPGSFYKRELPCLIALLENISLTQVSTILIDGFVFLDDIGTPGLGKHLYDYLNQTIPIIGIAKNGYHGISVNKLEVLRGGSIKPVFVTSVGIELDEAASLVRSMHGANRLPTMVSLVDQLSRRLV